MNMGVILIFNYNGKTIFASSRAIIDFLNGKIKLRIRRKEVSICVLPLTNPSPPNIIEGRPMRVSTIHYKSSRVFSTNFDSPSPSFRESDKKGRIQYPSPNLDFYYYELIEQNDPMYSRVQCI